MRQPDDNCGNWVNSDCFNLSLISINKFFQERLGDDDFSFKEFKNAHVIAP